MTRRRGKRHSQIQTHIQRTDRDTDTTRNDTYTDTNATWKQLKSDIENNTDNEIY